MSASFNAIPRGGDGSGWILALVELSHGRKLFRQACSAAVNDMLKENVAPQARILEIGSGLGELLRLAPELRDRIQQSDRGISLVKQNRSETGDQNIIVADAGSLPFRSGSYDAVIGFSVLDTIMGLAPVLEEIRRVLTPGGKFIHFLDLQADSKPLVAEYYAEGIIAFPMLDSSSDAPYFRLVPEEEAHKLSKDMSDSKFKELLLSIAIKSQPGYKLAMAYAYNPVFSYEFLNLLGKTRHLAKFSRSMFPELKTETITSNDFFYRRLSHALPESGFKTFRFGKISRTVLLKRSELEGIDPSLNVISSDVGFDNGGYNEEVTRNYGADTVETTINVHTVIATK